MWVRAVGAFAAVAGVAAFVVAGAVGVSGRDTIRTIAGPIDQQAALKSRFAARGMAVDGQGNVYFQNQEFVYKLSACGTVTRIGGTGKFSNVDGQGDGGPATSAYLGTFISIAADLQGDVYVSQPDRLRKISSSGTITTFAGAGDQRTPAGDGGPAVAANVFYGYARGLAVDDHGNVFFGQEYGVRKVSPNGIITTVAGTGEPFGPPTTAAFIRPGPVAVDGRGNLYFVDAYGVSVSKLSPDGIITTFAGTGKLGASGAYHGDGGPATKAQFDLPGIAAIAADAQGNVYLGDGYRVLKVGTNGIITTVAGSGSTPGNGAFNRTFSGSGGPANKALLNDVLGLAVDPQGNLYIDDGRRVLEVSHAPLAEAGPRISLGGAAAQRLVAQQGITVTAGCDRPSSLFASGSVKILGTPYVFPLTGANETLTAAGSKTLTLRFPVAAQQRFKTLLKPGQRAQATVTVRAVDHTGHTCTSTRLIAVKQ
jgi:sugar lactone lactonase YvrE